MNFGFPHDLTAYKLFTDWGSLIVGDIALVARETREAANLQIAAIERQRNANLRDAVRIEVTAIVKYIAGAIELCCNIANGTVKIPRAASTRRSFWE